MSYEVVAELVDGVEEARPLAAVFDGDGLRSWVGAFVDGACSEGVWLAGEGGLLTAMVCGVLQAGLDVEMVDHLGFELYDSIGRGSGNSRNGAYPKMVRTDVGRVGLRLPRDCRGTFDSAMVSKRVRRLEGGSQRT